jgi:hypothetical protein
MINLLHIHLTSYMVVYNRYFVIFLMSFESMLILLVQVKIFKLFIQDLVPTKTRKMLTYLKITLTPVRASS